MAEDQVKGLGKLLGKDADRARKAAKAAGSKPVSYGFIRLPGGISGGVAQLKVCGFFKYGPDTNAKRWDGNKEVSAAGQIYFRAAGDVVEPIKFQGQDLRGASTSIMHNLFDQKGMKGVKTLEDSIDKIRNELGRLCSDPTTVMELDFDEFESLAASLQEEQPFFKFSTSLAPKRNPTDEPKVFENWHGCRGLEDYTQGEAVSETVDDTEAEEVEEEAPAPKTSAKGNGKGPGKPATTEAFDEFGDLNGLAEKADNGDKKAAKELKKLALKAGVEEDTIDNADSWVDVVAAMSETEEEVEEEEVEEEESTVAVGDVVKYKSPTSRKAASFKVTAVEDGKVSLRGLTDKSLKFTDIDVGDLEA